MIPATQKQLSLLCRKLAWRAADPAAFESELASKLGLAEASELIGLTGTSYFSAWLSEDDLAAIEAILSRIGVVGVPFVKR